MKNYMITPLALVFALGVGAGTAMAQSAEDQAACRGDALKFCASSIGKPDQMKPCLEKNKSQLSDSCKKVVQSHGG